MALAEGGENKNKKEVELSGKTNMCCWERGGGSFLENTISQSILKWPLEKMTKLHFLFFCIYKIKII